MESALPEPSLTSSIHTCPNVRDLGGYDTPQGPTRTHRFVRTGGTRSMSDDDLARFRDWGVTRVIDLRSAGEIPNLTCRFAKQNWVSWTNVPLYDYDLSSPALMPIRDTGGYLASGYLHMLASRDALKRIFACIAPAAAGECVLFHCAAGMDRTGVLAMLLLGLADVPRTQIIADYAYSFGTKEQVDELVFRDGDLSAPSVHPLLRSRLGVIATVYDTLVATHGNVWAFLESCGIEDATLDAVRNHLLT